MRYFLVFYIVVFSGALMAIEEPQYSVIDTDGSVELRLYEPMVIAQVVVSGSMKKASNKGFKLVADYIFGNNQSQEGVEQKIKMTAPVTINQPMASNRAEKIDMTAPVTIEPLSDQWRLHFVMPRHYTLATLPKPNNPKVTLHERASRRYAVIQFSGFTSQSKVDKKTAELRAWLRDNSIEPVGTVEFARYNPPWTLPFWRRNEVMFRY